MRGERSLLRLTDELRRLTGHDVEPRFEPPRPREVRDSQADLSKARGRLGHEPHVDYAEGLRKTVAHFESRPGTRPVLVATA